MKKLVVLLLSLIFMGGCGSFSVDEEAKALVDNFYTNIKTGNYQANFQYFSDDYWSVTAQEQTLKLFNWQSEKVGRLQSYELSNYMVSQITGGTEKPAGKVVKLYYVVTWSDGTTEDSFLLFKPKDEIYKVDGYHTEVKVNLE